MVSLEMNGAYNLDNETIDNQVKNNRIGNYALGYYDKKNTFIVKYVGRSDTDLNRRLKEHVRDKFDQPLFKYSYATTVEEAYKKECKNYHDFKGGLLNDEHPKLPKGKKCLYCSHVGE